MSGVDAQNRLMGFKKTKRTRDSGKKMAVKEGNVKTSSQNHTEHENTANTTRPEINLKMAELTIDIWERKDPTEKGKIT